MSNSFWKRISRESQAPREPNPAEDRRLHIYLSGETLDRLKSLAGEARRPVADVAADLIDQALSQRQRAEANLRHLDVLSPRERQVAAWVCEDYTNRQIAAQLVISPETVKTHVRNILHKTGHSSRTDLRRALTDWDLSSWR